MSGRAKACASKINEIKRAQMGLYGTYTSESPLFCLAWTSGLMFVQATHDVLKLQAISHVRDTCRFLVCLRSRLYTPARIQAVLQCFQVPGHHTPARDMQFCSAFESHVIAHLQTTCSFYNVFGTEVKIHMPIGAVSCCEQCCQDSARMVPHVQGKTEYIRAQGMAQVRRKGWVVILRPMFVHLHFLIYHKTLER